MTNVVTLSPKVPQPGHVPDALVYDFDFYADPGLIKDAHARVLELIEEAPPIFWSPRNGGQWFLKSHDAVFKASRDPSCFTSELVPYAQVQAARAELPAGAPHILVPTPITMDPPLHTIYRAPLQNAFSPKAMAALKGDIRALAVALVEKVKPAGQCDFMSAIAEPMPVQLFLTIFGLPLERQREYRDLVTEHAASTTSDPKGVQRRLHKLAAIMHDTIVDRRDNPKNDVISMLWKAKFEGKPATLNDIEDYCVVLFVAGLDTVMNGMGFGVRHLAAHSELQTELRANPSLIAEATEELLRRYTFTLPPRFVAKDLVFEGVAMKKGEKAVLFLPAADLDGLEYSKPEEFNLARENKVHIAFGTGPHRCLGSHLARLELQILYEEMLTRLPEFRLDPAHPVTYRGGHTWGLRSVHLLWSVA